MSRFGFKFGMSVLSIILMVCIMSACGMKGDLYLPENTPQVKSKDQAAQKQKKDSQEKQVQPAGNNADDSGTVK